ncbi:VaFE repeat-containing surface-anchored protein [Micrococcales bacterium 31B]|nr:VaFE repeat-containing surface-anchored protein [Micrococcales bacterium 31B]
MNILRGSRTRLTRVLAASGAAAVALTGSAIALSTTHAFAAADSTQAATAQATTAKSTATTATTPTTTPSPSPTSGATITTVATDKADGDKSVAKDGVIKDVVTYTGLHVGTVYVLQTQLFDKTTGMLVNWTAAKIFSPSSPDGTETVEIPVPAGAEGHTFVVYQTIWAGADALVGKHLDKVKVRPGATPVASETNPNEPQQTVTVPAPPAPTTCSISGLVWKDANRNQKLDAGEEVVPNLAVDLRSVNGTTYPGRLLQSSKTDANGRYSFTIIDLKNCANAFVDFNEQGVPAGWNPFAGGESVLKPDNVGDGWTNPYTIPAGGSQENVNMGLQTPDPTKVCTVSGTFWRDENQDGNISNGETRVGGAAVSVFLAPYFTLSHTIATGVTDANGFYQIRVPDQYCGKQVFVQAGGTGAVNGWSPFWGGQSAVNQSYAGYPFTVPKQTTLGQNTTDLNVGWRITPKSTVHVNVCSSDFPTGDVDIELRNASGGVVASGHPPIAFNNLAPGTYSIYYREWSANQYYRHYVISSGDIAWQGNHTSGDNGYWDGGTNQFTLNGGDLKAIVLCGQWYSPISLDLNGNGKIDTSNVADQPAGAAFDLLGTGSPVASGWLDGGDGFLVAPSADGSVTSIDNLFGGAVGQGYAKLATRDANGDGVLTVTELSGLKVWVDANGDHVAQPGELHLLREYGVTSISVRYVNAPVADSGNVVVEHSSAGTATGGSIVMGDAYFALGDLDAVNARAAAEVSALSAQHVAGLPADEQHAIAKAFGSAR